MGVRSLEALGPDEHGHEIDEEETGDSGGEGEIEAHVRPLRKDADKRTSPASTPSQRRSAIFVALHVERTR